MVTETAAGRIRLRSASGRWIIVSMGLGSGMIFLDGSVVNVALPTIQRELGASLSGLQWVVNAYILFVAALLLVGGDLGDIYGRKLIFLIGLTIFALASAGCGLSPNLSALIAMRAIQGVGGALLVPGSLAIIKAVIADEDSSQAIGLWVALSGTTAALGPLVGGYLIDAATWRAIFFINVPLGLLAAYSALVHVPTNKDEGGSSLDWPGTVAVVGGLSGMTFGLIEGPSIGWGSEPVPLALVLGAVCLLLFPLIEWRTTHPMMPLAVWRSRNFTGSNLTTVGAYFAFNGALVFLVLDLQQVQGYTPLEAGAAFFPISVIQIAIAPRIGVLMERFGARTLMTVGPALVAGAFILFASIGRHGSYWFHVFPAVIILSVGLSIFVTPLASTVMSAVPRDLVGTASGINNTMTRIAGLLAIAVLGIVVATRFNSSLSSSTMHLSISPAARASLLARENQLANDPLPSGLDRLQQKAVRNAIDNAFANGFHWAMIVCAVLCVVSAAISALLIRDPRSPGAA